MRHKRGLAPVIFEVATVLLITAALFQWGRTTALAERGYVACGGEYVLLLLPLIYGTAKRTILDWTATLRKKVSRP